MSRVEFHDPDGLYPLVAPHLKAHLPLKNLYWSSSARPLRSIASLNVDFVPSAKTDPSAFNSKTREDGGRKHQLAGLRATPLLKIYLLRCDDKESYKALKSSLLRDWLEDQIRNPHGAPASTKHDACEWLILHVVLPNTTAATQPRWSKSSGSDDEAAREKSSSKRWPGKGSRGIFEKLRSDFSPEKKSDTDHVAQIRLLPGDMPPDAVPVKQSGAPADHIETAKERENAWTDLLVKLKVGILASFDLRVGQYEDDIHARDMQRNLPGWNFCTFLVLKEGLALAFESVGLVEDSLAVYDELSIDFETIVSDQLSGENPNAGGAFASSTSEAVHLIWPSDAAPSSSSLSSSQTLLTEPFNPLRKNYRELIAASSASIFDIRLYLCARRNALLLKLAKPLLGPASGDAKGVDAPVSSRRDSWEGPEKLDEMSALAKLCRSAPEAITSLARALRQDLCGAASAANVISEDDRLRVDTVVSAWTYAACSQLFADTASFRLPESGSTTDNALNSLSPMAQSMADQRSSNPNHKAQSRLKLTASVGARDTEQFPSDAPLLQHEGLASSAAYRADIALLQRRILERVAVWLKRPLDKKCDSGEFLEEDERQESNDSNGVTDERTPQAHQLSLIGDSLLAKASASTESLQRSYQELSDVAAVLYMSAGRMKSAERLMADVGTMKYTQKNYATAASYLGRVAAKFAEGRWSVVEGRILQMHMECLKMLNRRDDYLRVGLSLIAKSADARKAPAGHTPAGDWRGHVQQLHAAQSWLTDSGLDSESLLKEMAEYSKQLTYDLNTPLSRYFTDFEGDRRIEVLKDQDGFQIGITIRQLVADEKITVDSVQARLISSEDGQSKEINLSTTEPNQINYSRSRILLKGNVSTSGPYLFDKLTIRIGRISFIWESMGKANAATPVGLLTSTAAAAVKSAKRAAIFCYPRPGSLRATLSASSTIHLGKGKAIDLRLFSGDNDISEAQIILRSGSAGLRLRTAETKVCRGELRPDDSSTPGIINIGPVEKNSEGLFRVPYDLEGNPPALYVRLEIHYTTGQGMFSYFSSTDIDVELPIDVTVQDTFKAQALIPKFFIRATHKGPVRIFSTEFDSSDTHMVQPVWAQSSPATVFQHEPLCLAYKISQSKQVGVGARQASTGQALPLKINYRPVQDDFIQAAITLMESSAQTSEFKDFQWLLVGRLQAGLKTSIQAPDLEAACLTGKLRLPSIREIGLLGALDAVETRRRASLLAWLERWHGANSLIPLPEPESEESQVPIHHICIDFEVPRLPHLHTAAFILPTASKETAQTGRPLDCQIITRYTRRWEGLAGDSSQGTHFTYEVHADSDFWALSGSTRGDFRALPDEEKRFDIVAVPLRPGPAALPKITIRPLGSDAPAARSPGEGMDTANQYYVSPTTTGGQITSMMPLGTASSLGWLHSPEDPGAGVPLTQSAERGLCETDCVSAGDEIWINEGWSSVAVGLVDCETRDDGEEEAREDRTGFDGDARLLESY